MKKHITSPRWKLGIARRQREALKKKQRDKSRPKPSSRSRFRHLRFTERQSAEPITIKAPHGFSFIKNTDGMLEFFKEIKDAVSTGARIRIDLADVVDITCDGISVFISQMTAEKYTPFGGNYPNNEVARKFFESSGVYKYIRPRHQPRQPTPDRGLITEKRSQTVEPETANELIEFAANQVFGEQRKFGGVYNALIECMTNTRNHAAGEESHPETWWATVYCFPEMKTASFTFIDCGVGIFKSIRLRRVKKVLKALGTTTNADILRDMFHRRIASRTGLPYRGWGLPRIYDSLQRGDISNLILISNDAYGDVANNEYRPLKHNFKGTVLYWELPLPPQLKEGQEIRSEDDKRSQGLLKDARS